MTRFVPNRLSAFVFLAVGSLLLAGCGDNTEVADAAGDGAELAPLETDIVQGSDEAPITIIEYASMTCGHCAAFHEETYPALKEKYIDTGKVKYVLREFPLDQFAAAAFVTAHCFGDGNYYAAVGLLFENINTWAVALPDNRKDALAAQARKAGVGRAEFDSCIDDESLYERVKTVQESGRSLGVRSTPTFFVNGEKYAGALSIQKIDEILTPLLPAE